MSGVMVKAGHLRDRPVRRSRSWGPDPSGGGCSSSPSASSRRVLGVLYALMEHDLKRLLAFHSIENIGIILIGVGRRPARPPDRVTWRSRPSPSRRRCSTRSTTRCSSGCCSWAPAPSRQRPARATSTGLGGLARTMPATAFAFVIGAAAISGLPPLNGFASEWLTFQGLLGAARRRQLSPPRPVVCAPGRRRPGPDGGAGRRRFVKATGVASSRSRAVPARPPHARRAGAMRGGDGRPRPRPASAVGLAAGPVSGAIAGIAGRAWSGRRPSAGGSGGSRRPRTRWRYLRRGMARSARSSPLTAATWFVGVRRRPPGAPRRGPAGSCPEPAFEYTATSFEKPIRLFFGRILRPAREVDVELHPGTPFPRTVRYRGEAHHVIDERLYRPIHRAAVGVAQLALAAPEREPAALPRVLRGRSCWSARAGPLMDVRRRSRRSSSGWSRSRSSCWRPRCCWGSPSASRPASSTGAGASVLQPYRDLAKWWAKEAVESDVAGPMTALAPALVLAAVVVATAPRADRGAIGRPSTAGATCSWSSGSWRSRASRWRWARSTPAARSAAWAAAARSPSRRSWNRGSCSPSRCGPGGRHHGPGRDRRARDPPPAAPGSRRRCCWGPRRSPSSRSPRRATSRSTTRTRTSS